MEIPMRISWKSAHAKKSAEAEKSACWKPAFTIYYSLINQINYLEPKHEVAFSDLLNIQPTFSIRFPKLSSSLSMKLRFRFCIQY